MRVLDTETGQFVEKDPEKTRYAILSHTWDNETGEQTYRELKKIQRCYVAWSPFTHSHSRSGSQSTTSSTTTHHRGGSFLIPSLPLSLTPCLTPSEYSPIQLQTDTHHSRSPTADSDVSFVTNPPRLSSLAGGQPETSPPPSIWDDPELSPKIREACAIARVSGFRYIWIDSCCIDKSSSSELSEAINSMHLWYAKAALCYAYLADVPAGEDHRAQGSQFRKSRWFTRGWTLQELIAPAYVVFLAQDWTVIGSKHALVDLVESITEIDHKALLHLQSLDKFSVSQRLSWAAKREMRRVEDQAYSLLGIFDINMPTLYGEGNRAFRRLQEQIMQRIPHQSLFTWGDVYLGSQTLPLPSAAAAPGEQNPQSFECFTYTEFPSLLAVQPSLFMNSGSFQMIPLSHYFPSCPIQYDSQGTEHSQWYLAVLGCEHKDHPGRLLGQVCFIPPSKCGVEFLYPGFVSIGSLTSHPSGRWADLFPLSPEGIKRARTRRLVEVKTVYLSYPNRAPTPVPDAQIQQLERNTIRLVILQETCAALLARGYIAELRGPTQDGDHPTAGTHRLTLANDGHGFDVAVDFQHTREDDGRRVTISAYVGVSGPTALSSAQPGPKIAVSWTDRRPWGAQLRHETVKLDAGGAELVLNLGLDFAGMGIYSAMR
ncbi:HET-domain-containing protein [Ganoderma leucocontextum]|nr:HET-domain-containing protein [Ganoderma leucocontextum]